MVMANKRRTIRLKTLNLIDLFVLFFENKPRIESNNGNPSFLLLIVSFFIIYIIYYQFQIFGGAKLGRISVVKFTILKVKLDRESRTNRYTTFFKKRSISFHNFLFHYF